MTSRPIKSVAGIVIASVGLLALPVEQARGDSIVTDGNIVGDGISLQDTKDLVCELALLHGMTPPLCSQLQGTGFVFVTSTGSTSGGNFVLWAESILAPATFTDSLAAADAICQKHADDAAMPGTYKAWLSTDTINAKDRIGNSTWKRKTGEVVAESKAQLTSCTLENFCLQNQITDENGVLFFANAWTGTGPDGTSSGLTNCSGWTNNDPGGSAGSTGSVGEPSWLNSEWTLDTLNPNDCNLSQALICFGN